LPVRVPDEPFAFPLVVTMSTTESTKSTETIGDEHGDASGELRRATTRLSKGLNPPATTLL
jgi:hypothetical protein